MMIEIKEKLHLDRSSNCEDTISVGLTMKELAAAEEEDCGNDKIPQIAFSKIAFSKTDSVPCQIAGCKISTLYFWCINFDPKCLVSAQIVSVQISELK